MKSHKTYAMERQQHDGAIETYYLKKIAGVYCWSHGHVALGEDLNELPSNISTLDFSKEIEGKLPYAVLVVTVPEQTFVRKL